MVESSLHGVFQNDKYFSGLEEIAGTVRCLIVGEILITNFIGHLLEFLRSLETIHVPETKSVKEVFKN